MVGKIYARILVNGVYILTGGLIDDEHVGFRAAKGIVDQIFTLKQIGKKIREKKRRAYVSHRYGEFVL